MDVERKNPILQLPRNLTLYRRSESVGARVASLNLSIKTPIAVPFVGEREPGGVLMDSSRRCNV